MVEHEGISKPPLLPALSPARLAANRRNAQKSTGPKTKAGKRRVALNPRRLGLVPPEFERQLQARGEDPRDFRRLHRDVAALLQPHDVAAQAAVQVMAVTWWEKARRIRNWVAAGPARTDDLDKKIEDLLRFLVYVQRQRHERWQAHLVEVLGSLLGNPADVRRKIERRLFAFGATKATRTYPRPLKVDGLLDEFQAAFGDILAGISRKAATGPEPMPPDRAEGGVAPCGT